MAITTPHTRSSRLRLLGVVSLLTLAAAAQAQQAVTLLPSLTLSTTSDSNVLSSNRAPQPDVVERLTPGLRINGRSRLWTLAAGFTVDAERYERHPELNDTLARQLADGLFIRTGRTVTFRTTALYLATNAPQEINLQTGPSLSVARGPATELAATPSIVARVSARTSLTAELELSRTAFRMTGLDISTASTILTRGATAGVSRRVSPSNDVQVQFQERRFDFTSDLADAGIPRAEVIHAVLLGWTYGAARPTSLSITGGPRLSRGLVQPEVAMSLRHRIRSGEFALNLSSTAQPAVGETGTLDVHRLTARLMGRPGRRLELRLEPGTARQSSRSSGLRAATYLLNTGGTVMVASWLSLDAAFQGVWQRGTLPLSGRQDYDRRVFTVRAIVPGSRPIATPVRTAPRR